MPWKARSIMSQREEFVALVGQQAGSIAALCERFGISRQMGHKWLGRHRIEGAAGLTDRSRRPKTSPKRCEGRVERAVLAVRTTHPAWGGRKIRARLLALGDVVPPSAGKLGVMMSHGRPRHPQTQGKDERFHRTLGAELLRRADLRDHPHAQREFDRWRGVYNLERPHEALDLRPPVTRYRPSERAFPEELPTCEPCPGDTPVRVTEGGRVRLRGERWYLGDAWDQEIVGLRAGADDRYEVRFGPYLIGTIGPGEPVGRVRLVPLGRSAPSLHEPDAE